jgi:hypothetical protein
MRDMPQTFGMRSVTMRVKRILLKLVEDILDETFPTHSSNEQLQLLVFNIPSDWMSPSVLDNGIEMSIGFDKST